MEVGDGHPARLPKGGELAHVAGRAHPVERELAQIKRVIDDLRNIARPIPLQRFPLDLHKALAELIESIEEKDNQVDTLDREIKHYLTKLSQQSLTGEQSKREIGILSFVNNLENIGDIVDRNLMELAKNAPAMMWTFTGTTFLSALLLFAIQPMFAKMVLPMLGGTPAVWNTCVVFFQATLLCGYIYAHASTAWLGVRPRAGR